MLDFEGVRCARLVANEQRLTIFWSRRMIRERLEDYELIAQHVSEIADRVTSLENRVSDVLSRLSEVERVNTRLEDAALITARALEEISGHWDAVYEAMRRKDASQEAAER